MATEPRGAPTYPVWVGNLKEIIKESDLQRVFSKFGTIASCRLMKDEHGTSRNFGFVNFCNESEAERAAAHLDGLMIRNVRIKVKGPRTLREEKHLSPPGASVMTDYRPLTDCSFGDMCKKGQKCPYRHKPGIQNNPVCELWQARNCSNVDCTHRHPGGKDGPKEPSPQPLYKTVNELIKCDGQCGQPSCPAHFETHEDLAAHVKMFRKPQCRHCRAIFLSESDYLQHKHACPARLLSDSTDRSSPYSSESADIEQLSDSESTDEEAPLMTSNQYVNQPGMHKSASAQVVGGMSPSKAPGRSRTVSEGEEATKPKRRRRGKRGGRKTSNTSAYNEEKTDGDLFSMSAVLAEGMMFASHELNVDSESDSDDDDELNEDMGTDLNRLMSLNEMDMQDSSDLGEGSEAGEGVSGRAGEGVGGDAAKMDSPKGNNDPENPAASAPNKAHHRALLEPVGVFWDIENCPVPMNKSAFSLAAKIRRTFFVGKREAEFMCVCDITKERREVIDALNKAQVTLVHVSAVAKNAADDKLRQSLRRFAHTYPPPSTLVLISGDVNFSPELNDLRYIHNITIVLLHSRQASDALKEFANTAIDFDSFVDDVDMHTVKQKPILSRIVIVSNLPRGPVGRIKNRLDQLSDNCGGKVLKVDTDKGTARVLFRSNEWAVKSMKRMAGEDVFGYKIKTALEPPTPFDTKMQMMENISGPALGQSFPPRATPPLVNPPFRSPPTPPRRMDPFPPLRSHAPQMGPPLRGPMPPPPHAFPPPQPRPPPPFTQARPHTPMGYPPGPRLPSPFWPSAPLPTPSQLPPGPIPRPEGKILIYKILPIPETDFEKLNGQFVSLRLSASVKGTHVILWHSYSELQVLLRVDFIQTALARREEMVRTQYERGELRREIAQKFLENCVASLEDAVRHQTLPWDITLCGWTPDEEEERLVRSKVISLLRQCVPSYWTKWTNFKKRYLDMYSTAVSEMTVHNACRGAVQILGDASNTQSQVIVFYELSPLLKLGSNPQIHTQLQKKFEAFLRSRPERRVRLLDFVREYVGAGNGPLPAFSSGKFLQEIITSIPNVTLVGGRPSTIYVALSVPGAPQTSQPVQAPTNLSGISAAFRNLLMHSPNFELPYSHFQQEYQTFYHKSFRVSDYLPEEGSSTRQLIMACDGITLKEVQRNGKKETLVCLEQSQPAPKEPAPSSRPTTPAKPGATGYKSITELSASFVRFLKNSPNQEIPLKTFQQKFQSFYHRSGFRVSDYLPGNATTRDLIDACDGVKVWDVQLPSGKKEAVIRLSFESQHRSSLSEPRGSFSGASNVVPDAPPVVSAASTMPAVGPPSSEQIPAESIQLFRKDCLEVLNSLPEKKVMIVRFPEAYTKLKHEPFTLAKYNAKKILHLAQAIPDTVKLTGDKESKWIELINVPKNSIELCEKRIERLLCSLPDHQITLDRFMLAYEKFYGERLSHFYGHSKLIKLLENLPSSSLEFRGEGVRRKVILKPMRAFALEIEKLLSDRPQGLPINAVVPAYKEKFGRDLVVSNLGHPKLIRALEAIPDIIDIKGVGPARTIHLKPPSIAVPTLPTSMIPIPHDVTLPPANLLIDEVTALMVNHFTNKMTISNLTKRYNEIFRLPDGQPPVGATQLKKAVEKLDNFKVTSGHVELVETSSPTPKKLSTASQPPTDTLTQKVSDQTSSQNGFDDMPALVSVSPYKAKDKPSETKKTPPVSPVKDAERLSSETKRLLLGHSEHALTLSELVESFRESRDPARPTAEMLYESLSKHNTRSAGGQRFEISYISNSVGDTIVQLNRPDCLFKLSIDLQYLFIYRPTTMHTMTLSELEGLYAECYGHRLSSAVYGSPTVELLFDHKQVKSLVKLDQTTHKCSLTEGQQVLISLLSELVFAKGDERTLSMSALPMLYRDYFGCSLAPSSFGVKKISQLLQLSKVKQAISLDSSSSNMVLRIPNYVAEQMRHLLTIYNGQVPFSDLEHIHAQTFKFQEDIDIKKMLKNLVPLTSSVTNFAGNRKWLVWAPGGRPYPPHRRGSGILPPSVNVQSTDGAHSSRGKSEESFTEWPSFDEVPPLSQPEPPVGVLVDITSGGSDNQTTPIAPPSLSEPPPLLIRDTPQKTVAVDSLLEDLHLPPALQSEGTAQADEDKEEPSAQDDVLLSLNEAAKTDVTLPASIHELTSLLESGKMEDKASTSAAVAPEPEVPVDLSPYGFLEKDLGPELMAELIANAHSYEDEAKPSDSQPDLFDYLEDDLPPPSDPALDETLKKLILVSEAMAKGEPLPTFGQEKEETVERKVAEEPFEPVDYLEAGMNPDQVLEEYRKAKDQSGGVLTPAMMDPFLTYFGELSGQAIEQMEAEERKKKPKKAGPARKKPTMAIRFPGQPSSASSSAPSVSNSNQASVSGDNGRDSPLSSSSAAFLSQENFGSDEDITDKPSQVAKSSSLVTGEDSASNFQNVSAENSSQVSIGNTSGVTSAKIASIQDKSVADLRPFVLAAVDYTLSRGDMPSEKKDSPSDDSEVD